MIIRISTLARSAALAAFSIAFFTAAPSGLRAEERHLELYNVNTKEKIAVTFKRDGRYIDDALGRLNHFMRDWRRDESTKMDPKLFDIIWDIHRELGSKEPVHLISGFRSPKTNAMLRKTKGGQATRSRHMTGQAADIHFPDVKVKELRNSALIREQGGVGYYPTSAIPFVHVDTGRVRHWPRLPRAELAILFPDGKSQHVPTDGKPLTKKDFTIAMADLQKRGGSLPIAVQRRLNGGADTRIALASAPAPLDVPLPEPSPTAQTVEPGVVLASLTPFDGLARVLPQRSAESEPVVEASLSDPVQSDAGLLGDSITPDGLSIAPSSNVPQDQMAAAPEYDDDHPDELYYHPVPIAPFLGDTPIANMDMTSDTGALALPRVHVLFGESRQMLVNQFEPGLQYAKLYWSQQFRGTAVNTRLKRLVRDIPPAENTPALASQNNTRTAQK